MEKVRFGKTQMQVTPMTLGTWGIGGAGWDTNSDETRLDAIAAAIECGINFIDTAPAYNAGKAERYIGMALDDLGPGQRKKVQIATKCANAFIDTSIFGAQTRARVESNVSCLDWELTQEELQELDQAIEEAMG